MCVCVCVSSHARGCEGFRVPFRSESSVDETLPGNLVPAGFAPPDSLRRFGTVASCFDYQLVAVNWESLQRPLPKSLLYDLVNEEFFVLSRLAFG